MRSVEVYLRNISANEVGSFLTKNYPFQKGPPWIEVVSDDPCLYVDFNGHSKIEHEPDDWAELVQVLGSEPEVIVVADVSGRHLGDEQVKRFIQIMLTEFEGVARDDYTSHCWTKDEISSGHKVQRHHFFDYRGWYEEENA